MPAITQERIQQALNMPPKEALAFLYGKESTIYETFKDVSPEIFKQVFTVAGVLKMDILEKIRKLIEKAVEEGTPYQEWKKEMLEDGGIASVLPPSQLVTIYRTNLQSAYMAARYKQQKAIAEEKPFWKFVAVLDASTTDGCRDLDGKVFRHDDGLWNTNYPPRHYGCRSRVIAYNERELKKYASGITVASINENLNAFLSGGDDYKNIVPDESFATTPDTPFEPKKSDYPPDIWKKFRT